jgi:hypothetical protein
MDLREVLLGKELCYFPFLCDVIAARSLCVGLYRHGTAYSAHVSTACRLAAIYYIYHDMPVPPAMRSQSQG